MYKKIKKIVALCMAGVIISTSMIGQDISITKIYATESITEELRAEIEASLYDFEYYCMANEDVAVALGYDEEKMKEHWLNFGMAEGRNASMVFNAKYYLEVNPEVADLIGNDYIKAYEHFVTTGLLAGLESSPVFSVKYYLEANQDVAQVFGNDYVKAANHFNQNALAEGRSGSGNFDYTVYKDCNTDVANLYGDEMKGYYIHYINHGRAEGRTAGLGTSGDNGNNNAGGTTGIDENAVSYRIFDAEFYLKKYPNLAQTVGTEKNALYEYWLDTGIAQGQSASPIFDPVEYLSINTDVAEVVGNDYAAATNHFLDYGIYEGRSGNREFDYTVYKYCNTDVVEVFGDDIVGYYFHYVNYGREENRTATLVIVTPTIIPKPTSMPSPTATVSPTPSTVPSVTASPTPSIVPSVTPEILEENFNYEIKDGQVTIIGLKNKSLTEVVIPKNIQGYPVTSIGDRAFEYYSDLKAISIPSSVKSIGVDAFKFCSSLESITIPNGVTRLENGTFSDCNSLSSISIPNSVASLGTGVFWNCSSLKSITIPTKIISIEDFTFINCSSLISISIPNNVTSIGNRVFENCSNLKNIIIPSSVTSIGEAVFGNCSNLSIITPIGSYAESYAVENNIPYQKGTPITIPSSGKVTIIPEGTQEFIISDGMTVVINFENGRMTRQRFYDKEGVLQKALEYYYFNDEENANVLRSLPNYECIVWNREYSDGTKKSRTEDGLRDAFEYIDIFSKNEDGTITIQYKTIIENVIDVEDYDENGALLYERRELYDETDNLLEVAKYEYYYKQDVLTGWTQRIYDAENILRETIEYDAEGKEIQPEEMQEMTPIVVVAEGRKSFKVSNGERVTLVFDETGRIISQEHYDSDGIFKEQFDYYYFNDLDYVLRRLPNYDCIVWHGDYEDGSTKSKTEDSSKGGFSYVELLTKNGDGTVTVQYKKIPKNIAITETYNEMGILTYNRKELYDTQSNLKESLIYHYRENGTLFYHKKELYDGQGNLTEWVSYDYREDETLSYNKKEVYDEQGNLKESVFYHCREDGTLSYGKKYLYDAQGNVNESVMYTYYYTEDSLTGWTEQVYDTTSILRQTMYDAEGNVERWYSYEYDGNGKMSAIQYLGEGTSTPVWVQEYNVATEIFSEELVDNEISLWRFASEISPVSQFVTANNGYGVAYHGDGTITIFLYTKEMEFYNKVEIKSEDAILGAITSDENGYFYAVYGITNETEDVSKEVMRVVKYSSDGTKLSSLSYTGNETGDSFGTKNPFVSGNCALALNGTILSCNYARGMYNGHQSNHVIYINTTTMEKMDWIACYTSHAFDQYVISTIDGGFLFADHGDAFSRAFMINKVIEDGICTLATFHFREGANRSFGYNETYAQLGGLAELNSSYVLVGASERTLSLEPAITNRDYCGHSEARDLFIQFIKKDFASYQGADCYVVEGEERVVIGSKPEDALTELFLEEGTVDYGVIWLTDYDDEYLVYNPKVAAIKEDAIIILWQKVYYETEEIVDTYYAILDTEGNYIQEPVSLGAIPLSTDEPIICLEDSVYWSVTEGNNLTTYRLIVSEK